MLGKVRCVRCRSDRLAFSREIQGVRIYCCDACGKIWSDEPPVSVLQRPRRLQREQNRGRGRTWR